VTGPDGRPDRRTLLVTVSMALDVDGAVPAPQLFARLAPVLRGAFELEGTRVSVTVQDWHDDEEIA
jgi:hypothetical protein